MWLKEGYWEINNTFRFKMALFSFQGSVHCSKLESNPENQSGWELTCQGEPAVNSLVSAFQIILHACKLSNLVGSLIYHLLIFIVI